MKKIKLFEQFVNEAARVGRSSWSSILSDLKRDGWDIKGNLASKYYDEDGEERRLEIDNDGDDIWWTIYDENDKEINSGSFDGEGLSAGELDGEVWSYIEESIVNESAEEKEAKAILQDLLGEYDPWELGEMTPEEAEETVDGYNHKGSKAKKIAKILFNLASSGTFEAKINEEAKPAILVKLFNELSKAKNSHLVAWGYDDSEEFPHIVHFENGLESEAPRHEGDMEAFSFYLNDDGKTILGIYDLSGNDQELKTVKDAVEYCRANEKQ